MEMPKFNPHNPEYKKVKDLPGEEQEKFDDFENGFVRKDAIEAWNFWENQSIKINNERGVIKKIFNLNQKTALDLARVEAEMENDSYSEKVSEAILKTENVGTENENFSPELESIENLFKEWFNTIVPAVTYMIDRKHIDVVFSEETSARLPAEIILRAVNKIYKAKKEASAVLIPMFLQRHGNKLTRDEIASVTVNLFNEGKLKKGFLYVTEYVCSGNTLEQAVNGIHNGILTLQDEFESASEIQGCLVPMGGDYNRRRYMRKDKNDKEFVVLASEPSNTALLDTPKPLEKYSGTSNERGLNEKELCAREAFIEKMSNLFVDVYIDRRIRS